MGKSPVRKRHDTYKELHRWRPLMLETEDLLSTVLAFEAYSISPKTRDRMEKLRKTLKEEIDQE